MKNLKKRMVILLLVISICLFTPIVFAQEQVITPVPKTLGAGSGQAVSFDVSYSTANPEDETLNGLVLRMHWNSASLDFKNLTDVLATSLDIQGYPEADNQDYDYDPDTDMFLTIFWFDYFTENWPGQGTTPAKLYTANFTTASDFSKPTAINFSAGSTSPGYSFVYEPVNLKTHGVSVLPAFQNVSPISGTTTFDVTAHGTEVYWTATRNADWLSVSPGAGKDNGTITVNYEANSGKARTGTITVAMSSDASQIMTVEIRQGPGFVIVSAEPTLLFVPATSGTTTFDVKKSGPGIMDWTITENADWLSVTPVSGTDNNTISVSYEANNAGVRTGIITITAPGSVNGSQAVEIVQYPIAWKKTESIVPDNLRGIWGSSEDNIFAVGEKGTILRYDGNAWTKMASSTYNYIEAVWGSSEENVFAVGREGVILHYNGGKWTKMVANTSEHLKDVWGSSGNDVFAVGEGNTVLHYDGNSEGIWTRMPVATLNPFFAVWGSSGDNVFVAGGEWDSVVILHYDGTEWTRMELPDNVSGIPHSLWGSSGNNVFAVGDSGMILRYNGSVWKKMDSGSSDYLRDIWGTSGTNVFAVGVNGAVLRYDGVAWTKMSVGAVKNLYGVWGNSNIDVLAVGNSGAIFHYSPPILSVSPAFREVPAISGSATFEVGSASSETMEWIATSDVSWITIDSGNSGTDTGTVFVSCESNKGGPRTGTITVTAPGAINSPKTVEIRQGIVNTGDIDGNGVADLGDAILALKVLAGMSPEHVYVYAGINKDGKIGMEDILFILRMVVK